MTRHSYVKSRTFNLAALKNYQRQIMNVFIGIFCYTFTMFWIVRSSAVHDLWYDLFISGNYNPKVQPRHDPHQITVMVLNFHLMSIHGLEEVSEVLTTSGYISVHWTDDFLVWDPKYYNGVKLERWPQDDVWKPDLSVRNSVKKYKNLGNSGLYVESFHFGEIVWYLMEVFETICAVDTVYYPFDVQHCQLWFTSWSYAKDALLLVNGTDNIKLEHFTSSTQWELLSTSAGIHDNNETYESLVYFSLKMKRKPQHHLMTLFLPIILLAVLEVFVFAIPSDSGEKSGYAVTVFLAFAVFLTIVETTMPANSDKVSIFSVYLLIQTIQSTVITIISLCLIRCSSLDDKRKVPQIPLSLATFPHKCCVKRNKINIQKTSVEIISRKEGTDKRLEEDEIEQGTSLEAKPVESFTWKQFADSMDKLCFVVFLSIFCITTTVCFSILLTAPI